jgi:hypothetical protein
LVLLQQAPEAQDGGLVGQPRCTFQADKSTVPRALVQRFFHRQIPQVTTAAGS